MKGDTKKDKAYRTAKAFEQGQRWIRLKDLKTGDIVRAQEYYAKKLLQKDRRYRPIDKI